MATHSSVLAWRIPWTEEPGGPQSMGSHRVRHDWATNTTCKPGNFNINVLKSGFPEADPKQGLSYMWFIVKMVSGNSWKGGNEVGKRVTKILAWFQPDKLYNWNLLADFSHPGAEGARRHSRSWIYRNKPKRQNPFFLGTVIHHEVLSGRWYMSRESEWSEKLNRTGIWRESISVGQQRQRSWSRSTFDAFKERQGDLCGRNGDIAEELARTLLVLPPTGRGQRLGIRHSSGHPTELCQPFLPQILTSELREEGEFFFRSKAEKYETRSQRWRDTKWVVEKTVPLAGTSLILITQE